MNVKLLIPLAALAVFGVYTDLVVLEHGVFGFAGLALREPWAMQMLCDIGLSLACFAALAVPDARRHGIPIWPYLVASLLLGSLGAMPYFVHREIVAMRARRRAAATIATATA